MLGQSFTISGAQQLRRAGVPESTIMDISGWKAREMFKRYAITDTKDVAAAISKRERARVENGHDLESSGLPTTKDSNRITN
jgi:hypothetical protein